MSRSVGLAVVLAVIAGCSGAHSDPAITTDIQSRLFSDPQTKSANINVTTDKGNVTLAGQVPDEATREELFKVAQQTPGVKNVYDRIVVQQAAFAAAPEPEPLSNEARTGAKAAAANSPRRQKEPQQPIHRELAPRQVAQAVAPPSPVQAPQEPPPAPLQNSTPVIASAPAPASPAPPQPRQVEIPGGTPLRVQLIDPVDTSVNHAGDTFHATLAAPIVVDNEAVVPAGADVYVKLIDASSAGRIKGKSTIQLQLARLEYQGTSYALASDDYNQAGKNRGTRSAETIGGGAAIGAIIGAIAGGGKGAAIGAGVGGAGGTVAQAATHGEQIRLPAETKLDFTLQAPVTIRYLPDSHNQRR